MTTLEHKFMMCEYCVMQTTGEGYPGDHLSKWIDDNPGLTYEIQAVDDYAYYTQKCDTCPDGWGDAPLTEVHVYSH